jgi:hypothetical protein
MQGPTHRCNPLTVRSAAFRSRVFRGWNTDSAGLRSGEYCGKNRRSAPRASIDSSPPGDLVEGDVVGDDDIPPPESSGETLFDISEMG